MANNHRLIAVTLAVLFAAAPAVGTVFQFEVLGASHDWLIIRENIPASAEDTAACSYPGLDPSQYVGAIVHFFQLSAEAKRGHVMSLEKPASSMMLYAHGRLDEGCTSAVDAQKQWADIVAHAKSLGIDIPTTPPVAAVLGEAVPASACVLARTASMDKPPCRRDFRCALKKEAIRIVVSLTAIPEAPDERVCQFVGHRFGAAIQMVGLDFGKMGSSVAPGGFVDHYDCRSQQFDPLRLFVVDDFAAVVASFSGTNIASHHEYPFVIVFPTRPAR
jgi:hypothetical protein